MSAIASTERAGEDELRALRDAVREALAAGAGDAAGWQRMVDQLGLTGLVVDERYGGAGGAMAELAVVLEEMGRVVASPPLLATSLAAWAINDSDDAAAHASVLAGLAAGRRLGAAALGPAGAAGARESDGTLTGELTGVLDAERADVLVVVADAADGEAAYLVDGHAAGLRRVPRATIDPVRRLTDLHVDATPAVRLGDAAAVARLRAVAAVAVACEQVGGAAAALESAVDYAKVRTQFGRVIGSFQSIKHQCAEILLAVESARSAVRSAVRAVDDNDPELPVLAAIAKAWCSQAYVQAAETSLQIHGGIGFTWEHSAHLHLKRARIDEYLFGDARHHREHLAALLGLT